MMSCTVYAHPRRLYKNGTKAPSSLAAAGLGCLGPVPNNYSDCGEGVKCIKCDMLGMEHATDMLNGAWGYPNATTAGRVAIREAHIAYITGLLWFWATDPAAGPALHAELAAVGHCNDEFKPPQTFPTDPPNWPHVTLSSLPRWCHAAFRLCLQNVDATLAWPGKGHVVASRMCYFKTNPARKRTAPANKSNCSKNSININIPHSNHHTSSTTPRHPPTHVIHTSSTTPHVIHHHTSSYHMSL
jgi:hypothetical protein